MLLWHIKIDCLSTRLAAKLVLSPYPEMEVPNLLPAPSFSPVKSLLVFLLSILLAFCTFLYYHRFGYSLSCPRGSQPSSNTQSQGAAGKRARRKRKGKAKARSRAMAAVGSSSLLDSGVETIPVPILHPKATHAAEESQSSDSALLDRRLEHLMIPILEPVRNPVTARHASQNNFLTGRKMAKTVPWDGQFRWAIKGCSVFDDQQEEANALYYPHNLLSRVPLSNRLVFQYGLRYIPSMTETNVYRTVMIENLPASITLSHVLLNVSGEVYSARLFDTKAITGYNTAIVVFLLESEARSFVENAEKGLHVGSALAKVALVNTPTYPMPAEMDNLVNKGYSRCLVVSEVSATIQKDICGVLNRSAYHSYIERVKAGPSAGQVTIRFHCIKSAAAVLSLLQGHPSFRKCSVSFLKESQGKLVLTKAG